MNVDEIYCFEDRKEHTTRDDLTERKLKNSNYDAKKNCCSKILIRTEFKWTCSIHSKREVIPFNNEK